MFWKFVRVGAPIFKGKGWVAAKRLNDSDSHRAPTLERQPICKGSLITVFDPKAPKDSAPYWKYKIIAKEAEHSVPPGFGVEILFLTGCLQQHTALTNPLFSIPNQSPARKVEDSV
jgi:hypothetical protein